MKTLTLLLQGRRRSWLVVATLLSLSAAGASASAQTCTADTDCQPGFACVTSGASTPPVCKGADCPADAGAGETTVYTSCQPKACSTDADCGGDMICYEQKSTTCSGGGSAMSACAANTPCDAGFVITMTEDTCTTTTRNICAFKWQLPCSLDSDCGDGFVCHPTVSGACSNTSRGTAPEAGGKGGASSAGDASGATNSGGGTSPGLDAGTPECMTTTSFPGSCAPRATTCATDGDCPSGWTCAAIETSGPASHGGSVSGDEDASPPPAAPIDAAATTVSAKTCVSPFGTSTPPRVGGDSAAGGVTSTGSSSNSGAEGSGTTAPPSGATGGAPGNAARTSSLSSGGCSVAPGSGSAGGSTSVLVAFGMLALVVLCRRSRKARI